MTIKPSCIILIDDNPADYYLHKRVIAEAGCARRVVTFEWAEEALQQLRARRIVPDLIFLDVNMPGMDGWEFLDECVKLDGGLQKAVVIVMLTTSLNPADEEKAKEKGLVVSFLSKPLTVPMCLGIVGKHFGG